MKRLPTSALVLLIGLAILTSVLSCVTDSDKEDAHRKVSELKGAMQTVITRTKPVSDLPELKGELSEVWYEACYRETLDRHGNRLEDGWCDDRLGFAAEYTYEYDEKGNIVESKWYDDQGSLVMTHFYKYNDYGMVIERVSRFDENWPLGGNLERRTTYEYDENGNLIKHATHDSEGQLKGRGSYRYDSRNLIESVSYDSEGAVTSMRVYKYDDLGNMIESAHYAYYDSEGSLLTEGLMKERATFGYANDGNEIEWHYYDSQGSLLVRGSFDYLEFDNRGNWTKRVGSEEIYKLDPAYMASWATEGEHQFVTHRTIIYYEDLTKNDN